MSEITRKDFLRLTSWGILATLLPVDAINALNPIKTAKLNYSSTDFEQAKEFAQNAREKFYIKNYALAESLYLQAIALAPSYVQFYDGLSNVYGAQNKHLENVLLFKNALQINTSKIVFYDRAARSLLKLETGYKDKSIIYKNQINSASLLADAANLYNQAILIDNTKAYLSIGLAKVNHKIDIANFEADFRVNKVFKNLKKQHKNSYKANINAKTNDQIKDIIARMDVKKRRPLIDPDEIEHRRVNVLMQKKRFYDILLKRNNISNPEKIETIEKLFQIDYKDPFSLKKVKTVYYANNKYYDFIGVRKNYATAHKTVFSHLGVMDAIELAYEKGQVNTTDLIEAINIGVDLKTNWPLNFEQEIEVVVKTAKVLGLKQDFTTARQLLESTMSKVKTSSISMNNRLLQSYARINFLDAKYDTTLEMLLIAVNEYQGDTEALLLSKPELVLVKKMTDNRQGAKFKDNLALYYLLHSTYIALQKTNEASDLLSRLYDNNHNDNFVLTRNQ